MAMSAASRQELNKLRELFYYFIDGERCAHCGEQFVADHNYEAASHGDARGKPLSVRITIDHIDGDHSNNQRSNHRLMHAACHKTHHARLMKRAGGKFA
jgi:hypothetical protein